MFTVGWVICAREDLNNIKKFQWLSGRERNLNAILSEADVEHIAKRSLKAELTITAIYTNLAKKYQGTEEAGLFSRFAHEEKEHARFWRNFLRRRKIDSDTVTANQFTILILTFVFGLLGMGLTLKILESAERKAIQYYTRMSKSNSLTDEENEGITDFLLAEIAHEEAIEEYEAKFDFFVSKIATIFTQTIGGLVLVLSTVIGFSGIFDDPLIIGISGLIVGITGALNTIVGFYFFGRTKRKINQEILNRIKMTCACAPQAYQQKIERYMRKKNYDDETAKKIAEEAKEKNMIERIIAEEEHGIKESALGNPLKNALYAGLFKIIGCILPLLPFLTGYPISISIPISIVITLLLLSISGTLVAIAAEVDIRSKIIELTSGGIILATLTYGLGKTASFLMNLLNLV